MDKEKHERKEVSKKREEGVGGDERGRGKGGGEVS